MNVRTQRRRLFDTAWVLILVLICVVVLVPWLFGIVGQSVSPAVAILAGVAIAHRILAAGAHRVGTEAALARTAPAQHLLGILALGVVWHLQGGMQHPMFLIFLLVPVFVGSLVLNVWQQQAALVLTVALTAVSLSLEPDLRALVEQELGSSATRLSALLPAWPRDPILFEDLRAPADYQLLVLGTFALAALTVGAVSDGMASFIARLTGKAVALEEEAARARRLVATMVDSAPVSEVIVAAATSRIVQASAQFRSTFELADPAGHFLLDVLPFAYPEMIRRLLDQGGEARQTIRLRERTLSLRIRAATMPEQAERLVRLQIEPDNELSLRRTLDGLDDAVVVLDVNHAISYMNEPATALFGGSDRVRRGSDLPSPAGAAFRWWDLGPRATARRELVLAGRTYLASLRRAGVAEGLESMTVLHLREAVPRG
jgi:PAS domain-containing protein